MVSWLAEYDKIFGIYIGDNIIKQTIYTAKDFLSRFNEFNAMVPNCKEWNVLQFLYLFYKKAFLIKCYFENELVVSHKIVGYYFHSYFDCLETLQYKEAGNLLKKSRFKSLIVRPTKLKT